MKVTQEMSILAPMAPEDLGNTSSKSSSEKRPNGAKRWLFVYNNPIEDWQDLMAPGLEGCEWIAGEEVGEQGTFHLQGYVEFPVKVRPVGYKGFPKEIHWGDDDGKPARGTRLQNVLYCSKQGGKVHGTLNVPRLPKLPEMYGWQLEVLDELEEEPDQRTIHWIWSYSGCMGKSSFCKYLCMKKRAMICSGKAADMKYMIAKYKEKNGEGPRIVVFDVPRSMAGYLSYSGIEEIKNGCFSSSKYESEMVITAWPHVVICANFYPDTTDQYMSRDHYKIRNVETSLGDQFGTSSY